MASSRKRKDNNAEVSTVNETSLETSNLLVPPSVLLPTEQDEHYYSLITHMAMHFRPTDLVEWIWLRDIVDCVWETQRLHRTKRNVLRLAMQDAMASVLKGCEPRKGLFEFDEGDLHVHHVLANKWLKGDLDAKKKVDQELAAHGFDINVVEAQAHLDRINEIEKLERLIQTSDHRRDTLLKNIEKRRLERAEQLRDVSDAVLVDEV